MDALRFGLKQTEVAEPQVVLRRYFSNGGFNLRRRLSIFAIRGSAVWGSSKRRTAAGKKASSGSIGIVVMRTVSGVVSPVANMLRGLASIF